jgi:hypothetical protein
MRRSEALTASTLMLLSSPLASTTWQRMQMTLMFAGEVCEQLQAYYRSKRGREREGGRERGREGGREGERENERERRERDRETERWIDVWMEQGRQQDRQTDRQTDRRKREGESERKKIACVDLHNQKQKSI